MKLLIFILLAFSVLGGCRVSTNDSSPDPSTAHNDVRERTTTQDSVPKRIGYTSPIGANFGWEHPWKRMIYDASTSEGLIIENSFPKGGSYTDSTGKAVGYRIFCTRIVNKNDNPVELTIHFPADSFPIPLSPKAYVKVFLPPDTMSLDKVLLYDYGATNLTAFMDKGLNEPTMLQKTIHPNEEYIFYIGALLYQADGVPRAGFVLKENDLFYKINLLGSAWIPCGQILAKR